MSVTRQEVLRLYKNLLLYSRKLTLTDPAYFRRRITNEFKENKTLSTTKDVKFAFQVKHCFVEAPLSNMLLRTLRQLKPCQILQASAYSKGIDYTKVPKVNESDLTENFVRGSGPGGSAVNKNSNCVVLTHIPTGTVIKCHTSRCQDENRKKARELLIAKLDDALNGSDSVVAQKKRIEEKKYKRTEYKKKKMAQLKSEWKKREGLV